ncbi:RHS repeat domain-containing protein [Egicoccus halophilus]|nr:RHS repeat domain-containing protein [Egicoccus halophilus]
MSRTDSWDCPASVDIQLDPREFGRCCDAEEVPARVPSVKTFPDSRGTIDYVYDAVGNLTSMTDAAGTVGYAYNAVNLPTTITEPGGHVIRYVYKPDSDEIHEVSFPTGTTRVTQTMEYLGDGEIKEITAKRGTATLSKVAYTYTPTPKGADTTGSLRRTRVLNNGNGNETTTYGYDDAGRLERATTGQPGQSSHFYEYDRSGNRTRQLVVTNPYQETDTF